MTRSIIAAAALVAVPLGPAIASDYYDRDVQTILVSVADLDLSTGWGMDRLINRLRGRIDDMCGSDEDCRDGAWLSADWQVARAVSRDQWRHRIAFERDADRRYYRMQRFAPPPPPPVMAQPLPRIAYLAIPAPPAQLVSKTTKVTTTTTRTTTITLTYRTPPATFRPAWKPRCACVD